MTFSPHGRAWVLQSTPAVVFFGLIGIAPLQAQDDRDFSGSPWAWKASVGGTVSHVSYSNCVAFIACFA